MNGMEKKDIKFQCWNLKRKKMSIIFNPSEGIPMLGKVLWLQWTTMYDVKGNEIFASDILENPDTHERCFVEYYEDGFWVNYPSRKETGFFRFRLSNSLSNLSIKIGNIYQNPELLTP